jgi:galactonate dehydratase
MAETYDVGFAPHCPLGPLAFAASLQLAACTLNFVICEMSMEMHYNVGAFDLKTFIKNPEVFDVADGMVKVLEGPGLGACCCCCCCCHSTLVALAGASSWPVGSG